MGKIAYKLFRQLKTGEITSLFINKSRRLPYREFMEYENFPTSGFAERPGWHCTAEKNAPHLKMVLKSGEVRVWKLVLMKDYEEVQRPENQGGLWYHAKEIMIIDDDLARYIELRQYREEKGRRELNKY
jgi:hypothetical protein